MARTDVRVSAIIIRGDSILLMHRRKKGKEYWVFPGGGVEDYETVEEGLVREVKEETNLDVLHIREKVMIYNEASEKEEPFFICKVSDGTPEIVGEEKHQNRPENFYELQWVKISDIEKIWLVPEAASRKVQNMFEN